MPNVRQKPADVKPSPRELILQAFTLADVVVDIPCGHARIKDLVIDENWHDLSYALANMIEHGSLPPARCVACGHVTIDCSCCSAGHPGCSGCVDSHVFDAMDRYDREFNEAREA